MSHRETRGGSSCSQLGGTAAALASQHPAPASSVPSVFLGVSFGAQGCVYAVQLRPAPVLDLVFVLVMRAQCPAVVQTMCNGSNLVVKAAKRMTNATDENIFGEQMTSTI